MLAYQKEYFLFTGVHSRRWLTLPTISVLALFCGTVLYWSVLRCKFVLRYLLAFVLFLSTFSVCFNVCRSLLRGHVHVSTLYKFKCSALSSTFC